MPYKLQMHRCISAVEACMNVAYLTLCRNLAPCATQSSIQEQYFHGPLPHAIAFGERLVRLSLLQPVIAAEIAAYLSYFPTPFQVEIDVQSPHMCACMHMPLSCLLLTSSRAHLSLCRMILLDTYRYTQVLFAVIPCSLLLSIWTAAIVLDTCMGKARGRLR